MKTIATSGITTAIKEYRDLKATKPNEYDFSEGVLNTVGYQLLQMDKKPEAIEVFKLNVELYPKSFNTYDSLGEAYMVSNQKELAIANYKKSLELNPQSPSGIRALAALSGGTKEMAVDPKVLDSYAGEYELTPNLTLTITSENGKLMGQATGQSKVEFYPSSETEFFLKVIDAQVTFVKDQQGKVTHLILHQNGRNMEAKKIR